MHLNMATVWKEAEALIDPVYKSLDNTPNQPEAQRSAYWDYFHLPKKEIITSLKKTLGSSVFRRGGNQLR